MSCDLQVQATEIMRVSVSDRRAMLPTGRRKQEPARDMVAAFAVPQPRTLEPTNSNARVSACGGGAQ